MALKTFKFGIGEGYQEISLPEEHILQVIEGNEVPKLDDVQAATIEALRNPINSKPLQEVVSKGEKVAVIVSDITRGWIRTPEFLKYVIDEINLGGVPDEDICIVIAQGTHRAQTREEDIAVCGKEVADRIKIYQHDCLAEDLVHVGDTSRGTPVWIDKHVADADKVIITGGITVHLMAGFGGGRKSILPGVAGDETIQKNHALALADEVGSGISQETRTTLIDHNRLNDDMCEAAALVNPCFLVNSVMDTNGDFARIVAGHWYDAWLEGTKEVMKIQGVKVKGQADVVIASPGGFPKDINLYQGSKTYDTAEMALKPGGIVISLLEAREINDPPEYMQSFHFNDVIEMEKAVRNKFTIPNIMQHAANTVPMID